MALIARSNTGLLESREHDDDEGVLQRRAEPPLRSNCRVQASPLTLSFVLLYAHNSSSRVVQKGVQKAVKCPQPRTMQTAWLR